MNAPILELILLVGIGYLLMYLFAKPRVSEQEDGDKCEASSYLVERILDRWIKYYGVFSSKMMFSDNEFLNTSSWIAVFILIALIYMVFYHGF